MGGLRHSRQKREASLSLPTSSVTKGCLLLNWRSDSWTRKVCGHTAPQPHGGLPCQSPRAEKLEHTAGHPSWEADPPARPGGGCVASRGGTQLSAPRLWVQRSPAGAPGEPRALLLPPEWMRSLPRWLPGPPTSLTWGCPRPISLCPPRGCTNLPDLDRRGHADWQACPGPSHLSPVRYASHPHYPLLQGWGRLAQCLPPCSSDWSRGGRPPSLTHKCREGCWSQPSFQDLRYGQ